MNYEDELERTRARRSRKRESTAARGGTHSSTRNGAKSTASEERWSSLAEPGSRASRSYGNTRGSRNRRKKGLGRGKKIAIGVIVGLLVVLAALVGGAYAYLNHHLGKANSANDFNVDAVTNLELSQEVRDKMEEGYWTIAVFGLDSRDSSTGKGNQSDVIMIANIDRKTGEIKLVSVFRDTYLNVNDKNVYNKINAAYAEGGPEQAVKALNKNLDLNITHYASFNWKAVATGINILGGVDIDVSRSEFYYINAFITETVKGTGIGSTQLKSAGTHHMDGVQAVAYGRLRLMDSDYARTERQRIVIQKAFEKAKTADLATLNSLVGNMFEMCATNIDIMDILSMAKDVKKYHLGETMGFPAARGEQRIKIGRDNLSCVIPQTLVSNVTSLHSFLFGEEDYTPSSTVQTISKKISDTSGLYNAGKEIDHVATDQGYVPKATTAAPAATEEPKTTKESSTEETSESGTDETSEGESTSAGESESESGMHPGIWDPQVPSESSESPSGPSTHPGESPVYPGETEDYRPSSPADIRPTQSEAFGPGFEETPEEATTSPGPASEPETSGHGQTSIIVVPPTTAASGSAVPANPAAPSSPADMTVPGENLNGPASQATNPAAP